MNVSAVAGLSGRFDVHPNKPLLPEAGDKWRPDIAAQHGVGMRMRHMFQQPARSE
jgi:hypothetical protein